MGEEGDGKKWKLGKMGREAGIGSMDGFGGITAGFVLGFGLGMDL